MFQYSTEQVLKKWGRVQFYVIAGEGGSGMCISDREDLEYMFYPVLDELCVLGQG